MSRIFKGKLRLKVGGTMNTTTGVMTGGVTIGHFMTSARLAAGRTVLTSRVSAGPTVQDVDELDATCTLDIEAETDSVEARNLTKYAADGGYVEVTQMDGTPVDVLKKFSPFVFGDFGTTAQKEAATNSSTLVGTNGVMEAEWMAAQADLPGGSGGSGSGG